MDTYRQPNTRGDSEKSSEGLSLEELFEMFPDEKTAMGWFERGWCVNQYQS